MPLHMKEFQGAEFQGFVENIPASRDYKLQGVLPKQRTKDINFAYGVINGEYAKAASVTGFNASAPLRDPKQLSKAFGSVAKIQHGTRLDEEQLLRFNKPRDDEEKSEVVEYIYDTTDELTQGVYDTEELLRAQAVYDGKIDFQDPENDVQINVDFNIPSANKLDASTKWDKAAAEPLKDIRAAVKQFKSTNQRRKPAVMHMTSATEAKMLQNEQIRTQVYGESNSQRLLTSDDLANVFSALGLPPYEINDDVINVPGKGDVPLLADDKVVFIGEGVGNTYAGPTAEKNYETGVYVITDIQETNPPQQKIFVGETVFPAIKRPSAIAMLNV